jgi:arylsulfatase A
MENHKQGDMPTLHTNPTGVAGRILDALKNNGFDQNTLVIFTSDNGPEHCAFERVKKFGHYSSGEFRG